MIYAQIQKRCGLIVALSAMSINIFCVDLANALSLTYVYRGNNFVELEGEPGIFSTNDRVTAQFTIDCAAAHRTGNCANLPYDDYFELGAVELEPLSFSAGPAGLPTSDGSVDIAGFSFSTDLRARIVDWDMDLFLLDPSGVVINNVDTDNTIGGPIDSAAALGGGAVVHDNPGEWRVVVTVTIDIKPSKKTKNVIDLKKGKKHIKPSKKTENVIDLKKGKKLKVAIVGSAKFDALQVNPDTVKFGPSGASPVRFKGKDYNHDGFSDLVLTFKLNETGIACVDESATLIGETYGEEAIEGSEGFTVKPCP